MDSNLFLEEDGSSRRHSKTAGKNPGGRTGNSFFFARRLLGKNRDELRAHRVRPGNGRGFPKRVLALLGIVLMVGAMGLLLAGIVLLILVVGAFLLETLIG